MNILIISPYYPVMDSNLKNNQPLVVHYFAKKWVEEGHNVLVIHTYPHPLKESLNLINVIKSLKNKVPEINKLDNVKVTTIEWYRWIPGSFRLLNIQRKNTVKFAKKSISKWGVKPDRIICHFPSSCNWLMSELAKDYNAPQVAMIHNIDEGLLENNKREVLSLNENYDAIGFRSINIKREFENRWSEYISKPTFIAPSGVPDSIIKPRIEFNSQRDKINLVFVGRLDENKNVETILLAVSKLDKTVNYNLKIIGSGVRESKLKQMSRELGLDDRVNFLGLIPREKVFEELRKSDVFIMVSHRETLGLVYLEAMACGCIVIGSKGTGIDGIVKDKFNGYLIDSNDADQLVNKLMSICNLELDEKKKILTNSYETVKELTDEKMSKKYLEHVINLK